MATTTTKAKTDGAPTFSTRNDIPADNRETHLHPESAARGHIRPDVADQVRDWNVKGPSFIALHKLFDELAEKLEGHVDEIAERHGSAASRWEQSGRPLR